MFGTKIYIVSKSIEKISWFSIHDPVMLLTIGSVRYSADRHHFYYSKEPYTLRFGKKETQFYQIK